MEPDPDEHIPPGQEDLQWGPGVKESERNKGGAPSAKYSKLSEQARRLMAGESQCAMFCGGKKCKYCTADNWKPEQMAIKGLYSEWVTDNILAMARPSNHSIEKYKILEQFKEHNIKTVINLQQPGEHASCGYGNDPSGFSYNPQLLMEKEIFFYNFAWQDYGIAPMSTLLDIVKVMQFAVSMGKVAVHCHAGLGRTGLLIACYLVYNNRMDAGDAVRYVRSRRPGAIQTSQQVQTVSDFETHLKPFRTIFPSKIPGASEVSFKHFLNRQSHLLHGFEARKLKHIPKVVYVCCERLLGLAGKSKALSKMRVNSALTLNFSTGGRSSVERISSGLNTSFSKISVRSDNDIMRSDIELTEVCPRNIHCSKSFEDLPDARFKRMLSVTEDADTSSGVGSADLAFNGQCLDVDEGNNDDNTDDDDCIIMGVPSTGSEKKGGKKSEEDSLSKAGKSGEASDPEAAGQSDTQKDTQSNQADTQSNQADTQSGQADTQSDLVDSLSDQVDGSRQPSVCSVLSPSGSFVDESREPGRKRKVKKKGLVERLKDRSKKQEEGKDADSAEDEVNKAADTVKDEKTDRAQEEVGKEKKEADTAAKEKVKNRTAVEMKEEAFDKVKEQEVAHADHKSFSCESDTTSIGTSPSCKTVPGFGLSGEAICEAMAATEYSQEVRERADTLEIKLNKSDVAWSLLGEEKDPYVLSAVLYDWLDQLKEPVLSRQNLTHLVERSDSPRECLQHIEKSVKHLIEYLALVVSNLFPQSESLETRLIERLLSVLTHMSVSLNSTPFIQPYQPPHWGEMKSSEAQRLVEFFFRLIGEVSSSKK